MTITPVHPAGFTSARSPFSRLRMRPMQQPPKGFLLVMGDGTRVFFIDGAISRIDFPRTSLNRGPEYMKASELVRS